MTAVIVTGASRGIGRALALELAREPGAALVLSARERRALDPVAAECARRGADVAVLPADLSSLAEARRLAQRLASLVGGGATLVSNAGVWPSRRELTADGLERAFAVNAVSPVLLAGDLLAAGAARRVLAIGAGLMVKGRFDASRTPRGDDFSSVRTYCSTKLALALAMRDVAAAHPQADVAVVHPGVVRTALGDRGGALGLALRLAKRRWEAPERTATRLAELLRRERWAAGPDAQWLMDAVPEPWPAVCDEPAAREAVRAALRELDALPRTAAAAA